jgi:hypothetical protein
MYKLTLIIDLEKDAWNRRNACNKVSHWVNRKEKIDISIAAKITGKTQDEANNFLFPYLKNFYKENEQNINNPTNLWQQIINKNINDACLKLEKTINKKLYKENFFWYITTFPRGPYNYETWSIWLYYNWSIKYYIWFFLHELLHFQFIHDYKNHPAIIDLNNDEFEFLKESLTIILNHELKEFLWKPDQWYIIHQKLREKLDLFWQNNKNFEELVIYWSDLIKNNKTTII